MVYFTVPNNDGWTATIDGIKADIIDSGGMMLLKILGGNHNIEFLFHTLGLRAGALTSIISCTAFGLYTVVLYTLVMKKKETTTSEECPEKNHVTL